MIKIRFRNADHEIDIRFPISESELYAKLGEIHAVEGRDAAQSAFVTGVYWPEEFSVLKDRFANLDELNYLGKRMESFDTLEYDQFLIGILDVDLDPLARILHLFVWFGNVLGIWQLYSPLFSPPQNPIET